MDMEYDVIVVGAGNGGLVAAANTAKAGLKTLVLEKHNLPGGCATSFRRGRFEFEPSLHELCSVGTEENPRTIRKILNELGADVELVTDPKIFRAIAKGENGYDVSLNSGIDAFCDAIDAAVPGCRRSVRAFLDLKDKIDAALAYVAAKKGHPNPVVALVKHGDFLRVASHSVEEVMDALGIPKKAQDIIGTYWSYLGVPTDELNAMHYINMIYDYIADGAAMPRHRSHELSAALADAIYRADGDIWYNSEVTEFLYHEDGSAAGVVVNGQKLYAKQVISNVIPHNVFAMSDAEKLPEQDLKLANARKFGCSIATVYLGLDCTAQELGMEDYAVFVQGDPDPRTQHISRLDGNTYIVNCLNNAVPDSSPEGTCMLFFSILFYGSDMPQELQPQDYKKYKNDLAKRYIEDFENVMGISILPHIEEISVATPVTFARYLGTPDGAIYGYELNDWDGMMSRILNEKKDYTVPGLTFCGGHHSYGDGFSSAYIMGNNAGKRVVKRLGGEQ